MQFRRTAVVANVTPAADGSYTVDLPVKPLSHLIITLKTVADTTGWTPAVALAALENIEVLRHGSAIVSISAADLYALNCVMFENEPWDENWAATSGYMHHVTLIVPFGRELFNPAECLPETIRGELTFRYTVDIADTGYTSVIMQVEAVELLDANPADYLKYVTATMTPTATGNNDVELPIGNEFVGILLWGTTVPATTAWTTTIERITLLVDNIETYYRDTYWTTLHGDLIRKLASASAYTTSNSAIVNYSYMDFDPRGDGSYLLESRGLSDLALRVYAGDTNPLRVISLEKVGIGGGVGARAGQIAPPAPPPLPVAPAAGGGQGYRASWAE